MRKLSLILVPVFLLGCDSGGSENDPGSMCSVGPDGVFRCVPCDPTVESVGPGDMTPLGVPSDRIDQASGVRTATLTWHGGAGIIDVTPASGTAVLEAELVYDNGAINLETGGCELDALVVAAELRLTSDDGALIEAIAVEARGFADAEGLQVDMFVPGISGSFDFDAVDPTFSVESTRITAVFDSTSASGEIEATVEMEPMQEPDGGMSGGGPGPIVVGSWTTDG